MNAQYIENNGAGFKAVHYYSIIEGRMNCQHRFFQDLQAFFYAGLNTYSSFAP